ncbi:hypothetical protein ZIOFF_048812 [Zingiber officinale]|uniref:Uncharacterized protein n=1 Tax=Zingiber officinale TaxID=94328 RepID=A0A8J5FTZ2_ZINOF|nr:hypothetical protein ZIOFF_048812 [Zingiber officinale]
MEFLKIRSFQGIGKFKVKKDSNQDGDLMNLDLEKTNDEVLGTMPKADASDHVVKAVEDEDDDDFVTNEVKRRLKELRKNSFMVLIPEEGYPEEEEGGGSSSSGWRESEEGGDAPWCTFNAIYAKYTERMTFFDKLMVKSLKEAGLLGASKHSQSSLSKKLYMNLLNLPIKAQNGHCDGNEILRSQQEDSPCENLEAAYVSQVCLSWEILHNHFHIEGKSLEEKKSLLAKCAATTLSSKLIGGEKEFFANMVVEAILAIGNDDRLNLIGIICVVVHLIRMRDEFTNLKYFRVEIDEVRFEWAECMLDYI